MLAERIQQLTNRHRPQGLFPPIAVLDNHTFLCQDTKKGSYLGMMLFGEPLSGIDESVMGRIRSVLSANFPAGTYVQFNLLHSSDIQEEVNDYLYPKLAAIKKTDHITDGQKRVLEGFARSRANYFVESTTKPAITNIKKRLGKQTLLITVKVPCSTRPKEDEVRDAEEVFSRFNEGIRTVGMQVKRADASEYLAWCRACFMPDQRLDSGYEDDLFLRDQILPPGFVINTREKFQVDLNGLKCRVLSLKKPPKRSGIALMNVIMGDPNGITSQIPGNYMIAYTLHYPEPTEKVNSVRMRYGILQQQADGPLARLVPRIRFKKEGFDVLMREMDQGAVLVEAQLSVIMYSRDEAELSNAATAMGTYYSSFGLEMVTDSLILWPILLNHLPLFPSPTSTLLLRRFRTMAVSQAMHFLPILGDWTGSMAASAHMFTTRRGGVFKYDLYDSNSNYNGIVFAESGAGKSFLTQSLICDYLSIGAKVWCVDIGRSYEKLCAVMGGEFIRFSESSNICLNPFSNVVDIDEELDLLKSLLAKMAAPDRGLDDFGAACLQEGIKAVYMTLGNKMTVTDVSMYLNQQDDPRIQDIGRQLFPFTIQGQFGHWFNGVNNLRFESNFVVLELEELNAKPVLQQVVLMLLMAKIQHEMFLAGNGIKKIAIFDESWALFTDPGVVKFMTHGYRRFRKYEGAALLVLQSILDFYRTPGMEVIAENSAHKLILMQQATSVDEVLRQGKLALDEYGARQLKTVHTTPGRYSEIMFYRNGLWGIARLTVPKYEQILYATKGPERYEILKRIEDGEDADAVIKEFVERTAA